MDALKSAFALCFSIEIAGRTFAIGFDTTHAQWFDFIRGKEEGLDYSGWSFEFLKFYVRYIKIVTTAPLDLTA